MFLKACQDLDFLQAYCARAVQAKLTPSGSSAAYQLASVGTLLDLHHFKVDLVHVAVGTGPTLRYVDPLGTRCNAVFRATSGLVVDESANNANIRFHMKYKKIIKAGASPGCCGANSGWKYSSLRIFLPLHCAWPLCQIASGLVPAWSGMRPPYPARRHSGEQIVLSYARLVLR